MNAKKYLDKLCDCLEKKFDVDFNETQIEFEDAKGGTYLIHYHQTLDQIWLSSPRSGAHHFILKDDKWVSTRDQYVSLTQIIEDELDV